jgi:hypothetical protein
VHVVCSFVIGIICNRSKVFFRSTIGYWSWNRFVSIDWLGICHTYGYFIERWRCVWMKYVHWSYQVRSLVNSHWIDSVSLTELSRFCLSSNILHGIIWHIDLYSWLFRAWIEHKKYSRLGKPNVPYPCRLIMMFRWILVGIYYIDYLGIRRYLSSISKTTR